MITWVDIVIKAFKAMEKEAGKKINIKDKKFVVQVGKKAQEAGKVHQPDIDRKINFIVSVQGKENFERVEKQIYRLAKSPDANRSFKEEIEWSEKFYKDNEKSLSVYERLAIIKVRIGQGGFRKKLHVEWGGCSVTEYPQIEMLIASHIKPWKDANDREKLDINNGLLLTANLDKVFDRGFITFADDGRIRISEDLDNPETLGINPDMELSKKPNENNKKYLKYHREKIFLDRDVAEEENDDKNEAG